ncbi:hypothetical protein BDV97DRAFT_417065 [Delphinella strobiligena]|nr:hypothetical protein BDV97DRAFT_417065 [Delphinella strobiligena]
MSDKLLVLITGANQGLGYHAAQQLATTGKHHVLLGSRDIIKAENAIRTLTTDGGVEPANVEPIQIDVNSDYSISTAAQDVEQRHGRLDVLMLNAGIVGAAGSTRDQYAQVYNTNVFGAAVAVDAFLPLLRRSTAPGGKRIAFPSSCFGSIELAMERGDFNPKAFPHVSIYRSSKTAINMIMGVDPGFCATNMNAYSGLKDASEGAKVLIHAATGEKNDVHGRLINENGVLPW